jgi:hypothetical protein
MMRCVLLFMLFVVALPLTAQQLREPDPCGTPDSSVFRLQKNNGAGWGYTYDSLRADITRWRQSPYVTIDSVGATVQRRTMYVMTIHNRTSPVAQKKRIWIHARTHPNEVQGTWVTNEIIRILLSETSFGMNLRDSCVFSIMPMYNPDGVELGKLRENANNIDIESNWTAASPEPEVQVLRAQFVGLMSQSNPIRVALNMHSAYGTNRYFVYHMPAGTSPGYGASERQFIAGVQNYFPGGIRPYNFFTSWPSAPALQYPESWFWVNHREAVMALTYEDMNDPSAEKFDITANAILHGITDYLGVARQSATVRPLLTAAAATSLDQNYPNPFNPSTTLRFSVSHERPLRLTIADVLGRVVATLVNATMQPGTYSVEWNAADLPSGMYIAVLRAGNSADGGENVFVETKKLLLQK